MLKRGTTKLNLNDSGPPADCNCKNVQYNFSLSGCTYVLFNHENKILGLFLVLQARTKVEFKWFSAHYPYDMVHPDRKEIDCSLLWIYYLTSI